MTGLNGHMHPISCRRRVERNEGGKHGSDEERDGVKESEEEEEALNVLAEAEDSGKTPKHIGESYLKWFNVLPGYLESLDQVTVFYSAIAFHLGVKDIDISVLAARHGGEILLMKDLKTSVMKFVEEPPTRSLGELQASP
jgi:hypothetical protein